MREIKSAVLRDRYFHMLSFRLFKLGCGNISHLLQHLDVPTMGTAEVYP